MEKAVLIKLQNEHQELEQKITNLINFLNDEEKIKNINDLNKDLLISQLRAMQTYLGILTIRIGINMDFIEDENVEEVTDSIDE